MSPVIGQQNKLLLIIIVIAHGVWCWLLVGCLHQHQQLQVQLTGLIKRIVITKWLTLGQWFSNFFWHKISPLGRGRTSISPLHLVNQYVHPSTQSLYTHLSCSPVHHWADTEFCSIIDITWKITKWTNESLTLFYWKNIKNINFMFPIHASSKNTEQKRNANMLFSL